MIRHTVLAFVLAICCAAAAAQTLPVHTFSIVARDPKTGPTGIRGDGGRGELTLEEDVHGKSGGGKK